MRLHPTSRLYHRELCITSASYACWVNDAAAGAETETPSSSAVAWALDRARLLNPLSTCRVHMYHFNRSSLRMLLNTWITCVGASRRRGAGRNQKYCLTGTRRRVLSQTE